MQKSNEEMITIKQFIITLILVLLIVSGIYFFTKIFVTKENNETTNDVEQNFINPEMAIIGTMLNKDIDKYYVIIYNVNDDDAASYAFLLESYSDSNIYVRTYWVDLSNPMNSKYIATGSDVNNISENIEDLKFGEITLLKIENNKITKAFDTIEKIKKEWKLN